MKKISIILVMLFWCNVSVAAPAHKLIRTCAEYYYGQELTDKEFQSVMSPSNLDLEGTIDHEFVKYFITCEKLYADIPYAMQEIFD
jgi:hypothetical protein